MTILTPDMQRMLREHKLGWIATVCPDGTPNLSPKGTTIPWGDDQLVFAEICSPGTVANLRANPAMEIGIVDQWVRKGYRFKGRAEILESGPEYEAMLEEFRRQGVQTERNGKPRVHCVVRLRVERALPLVSPAYDNGATEAEVTERYDRYWEEVRKRR